MRKDLQDLYRMKEAIEEKIKPYLKEIWKIENTIEDIVYENHTLSEIEDRILLGQDDYVSQNFTYNNDEDVFVFHNYHTEYDREIKIDANTLKKEDWYKCL